MANHRLAFSRGATVQRASGSERLNTPTDGELLLAIGTHRDHSAFTTLFNRYKKMGLNVAQSVVGNRHGGEEAFQNAMLNIWSSAHSFRADGNPRGWIMKTVVRAAMNVSRGRKSIKGRAGNSSELEPQVALASVGDGIENAELLQGLRKSLGSLSTSNRQIVAYYYMCQKNQEQIGQLMDLPQSTVSYKLNEAIKAMRIYLQKAGLAAAVPLLTAKGMADAMAHGVDCPAELAANILQNSSLHVSSTVGRGFSKLSMACAVTVVCAGVLGWHQFTKKEPVTLAAPNASSDSDVAKSKVELLAGQQRILCSWNFDNGSVPKNLRRIDGLCGVKKFGGVDDSACLWIESDAAGILLDVSVPNSVPLRVSYQMRMAKGNEPKKGFIAMVRWNKWTPPAVDFVNVGVTKKMGFREWARAEVYLNKGVCDMWLGGKRKLLSFEQPLPNARLTIAFRGKQFIDNICIEQISQSEIPDTHRYLDALSRIPDEKRVGKVNLTGVRGADPSKPVSVFFWMLTEDNQYKPYSPAQAIDP